MKPVSIVTKTALLAMAICFTGICHSSAALADGGTSGGGGDIVCQNRVELIRNNIEERLNEGGANSLDFTGTGITAQEYALKIPKIMDLTRDQQSSIYCTRNFKEVSDLVGGTWTPICAAEWLDDKNVKPEDRKKPRILCYAGEERGGVYTGGLMAMSGNEQFGQIDHEFNVLAGFEDQKNEYSHYLIASRVSDKAEATIFYLWPANAANDPASAHSDQTVLAQVGRYVQNIHIQFLKEGVALCHSQGVNFDQVTGYVTFNSKQDFNNFISGVKAANGALSAGMQNIPSMFPDSNRMNRWYDLPRFRDYFRELIPSGADNAIYSNGNYLGLDAGQVVNLGQVLAGAIFLDDGVQAMQTTYSGQTSNDSGFCGTVTSELR